MSKFNPSKLNKAAIPTVPISLTESKIFGVSNKDTKSGDNTPYVALKYFHPAWECLSDWSKEELKSFSSFLEKLGKYTWNDILKSGGSPGTKSGLGCTKHGPGMKCPSTPHLDSISPDITLIELRVTQRARVHGFRMSSAFFLVWLDKDHRICPS